MKDYKLVEIEEKDYDSFYEIMKESFPKIERRNYKEQKEIFTNDLFKVIGYKDENNIVIAFISYWNFEKFDYIEHFAVRKDYRGKKIGDNLIKEYLKEKNSAVLEVELPEDNLSKRRIEFYKRIGFKLNGYEYLQPPYEEGNDMFPLMIMSYPTAIDEKEFIIVRSELYKNVYKYSEK